MNNKVLGESLTMTVVYITTVLLALERELDVERRKVREQLDSARERDKEYQKLKVPFSLIGSTD